MIIYYQHKITHEVWTNSESMVEEINRRRRDPEYRKKMTEKNRNTTPQWSVPFRFYLQRKSSTAPRGTLISINDRFR